MRKWAFIFTMALVIIYIWIYVFQQEKMLRLAGVNVFTVIWAGLSLIPMVRNYRELQDKQRNFWLLLSTGTLAFIVAQLIWFTYQLRMNGNAPYPSWADLFWLTQYAFYLAALVYQLTLSRGEAGIRSVFNVVILMVVAVTLSVEYIIRPTLASGQASPLAVVTTVAYPLFDLGLLFALISLLYETRYSKQRTIIAWIAVGFLSQIMADTAHLILQSSYDESNWIDPLWILPILMNGWAAGSTRRLSDAAKSDLRPPGLSINRYDALPYMSVVVLLLLNILQNQGRNIHGIEIGLLAAMLLIIVRQLYMIANNGKLLQELQHKNEQLEKSEERYRDLVEISPSAIQVVVNGMIRYVNNAGLDQLGASSLDDIIGKPARSMIHTDLYDQFPSVLDSISIKKKSAGPFEFKVSRLDGSLLDVETRIAEISYDGERAYMFVSQDITHRKQAEEKITFLAYCDVLTGLPNRVKFHERLASLLQIGRSSQIEAAVLFIDLDRFKYINDSMGHSFGDLFLKQVGERLSRLVGRNGSVYRLGGDEFCAILEQAGRHEAEAVADSLLVGFASPFIMDGLEFFTSPSIGISLYPSDGDDGETLVRHADIAMYHAKKQGGNNYQLYCEAKGNENSVRLKTENELRKAIENEEFTVFYQPIVYLQTGEVIGVEALVRWQHPERGLVPPAQFISIAEETGLIVPIGKWVLQEACRQMKRWHSAGYGGLFLAVNLSPRQFKDKDLITGIAKVLNASGLEPEYLEIEITESIMQNMKESSQFLHELKKLGVQISIDDFGTGYSSLSCLKHLPIDTLKVDKSFIDDISNSPMDEAIIKTIVDMGHHLKVNVIAEGIETERQRQSLIEHHCQVGQGYLFSRPLSPGEVERLFPQPRAASDVPRLKQA